MTPSKIINILLIASLTSTYEITACEIRLSTSSDLQSDVPLPIIQEIRDILHLLPEQALGTFGYLEGHLLPDDSKLIVIGDLHGDDQSLTNDIARMQELGYVGADNILQANCHLVFTGDLADRGPNGFAVWQTAMLLKRLNPHQVHIIRGNHETRGMAKRWGFLDELQTKLRNKLQKFSMFLMSYSIDCPMQSALESKIHRLIR